MPTWQTSTAPKKRPAAYPSRDQRTTKQLSRIGYCVGVSIQLQELQSSQLTQPFMDGRLGWGGSTLLTFKPIGKAVNR